jgi:hypothetical protein
MSEQRSEKPTSGMANNGTLQAASLPRDTRAFQGGRVSGRRKPKPSIFAPFLPIAPVAVLLLALLLPPEVRFNIAGQTIYGYRFACFLFAPALIWAMLRGQFKFRLNDLIFTMAALWVVGAFIAVYGLQRGGASGVGIAIDMLLPYFLARRSIRTFDDFRYLLILLAPIALLITGLMALEAVTHFRFGRAPAQAVFGSLGAAEFGEGQGPASFSDVRYGFLRAMGPFSHPILAGTFFACLMPLYYFSGLRGWPKVVGALSCIGAIFSFSSAAIFGIIIFVGLAIYDRVRSLISFLNWPIFIVASLATLLVLHMLSNGGIISVLIRLTLNPQTGYFRLLIWEFGTKTVEANPWFGIAFDRYYAPEGLPGSVDAIWLAFAIRSGLPMPILLGLSTLIATFGVMLRVGKERPADNQLLTGLAVSLTMFFLIGFSVTFFGGLLVWFFILVGIGTTFSYGPQFKGLVRKARAI